MPRAAFSIPSFDELHDPLTMRDMPQALDAPRRGRSASGEKILIYGDYDVDGTTSVVLLTKAIELAGGAAELPHPASPQGRLRHAAGGGGGRGRDRASS